MSVLLESAVRLPNTKLDICVPVWYNRSMKDYTISAEGGIEITMPTLSAAKKEALKYKDPVIDEYSEALGELTGRYWTLENGKWVQHD